MGRSLGSGPSAVFRRVALPLAWRGILAGTLLAFSRALGEFGATIMIAGNIPGRTQTMALAIFQRNQIGQDDAAMRLVGVTVVICLRDRLDDRDPDAPPDPAHRGVIELSLALPLSRFRLDGRGGARPPTRSRCSAPRARARRRCSRRSRDCARRRPGAS